MTRKVRLAEIRSMVRKELLREWQDIPSGLDEFMQQQRVATKDVARGVERALASYEASVVMADNKETVAALAKKAMQVVYAALESEVFMPKSGMRQRAA